MDLSKSKIAEGFWPLLQTAECSVQVSGPTGFFGKKSARQGAVILRPVRKSSKLLAALLLGAHTPTALASQQNLRD